MSVGSEKMKGMGARSIPKWVMQDSTYTIGGVEFDITETLGMNSRFLQEQKMRDEAKRQRIVAGYCDSCRTRPCMCHEGQRGD